MARTPRPARRALAPTLLAACFVCLAAAENRGQSVTFDLTALRDGPGRATGREA